MLPALRRHDSPSPFNFATFALSPAASRPDLLNFLKRDFRPMNEICERGGMFEKSIYERIRAVFDYFDLHSDEEPPP